MASVPTLTHELLTYLPFTDRLRNLDRYARGLLTDLLPKNLPYHGPAHTLDPLEGVVSVADRLARAERIPQQQRELVVTAAYLHDAGFIEQYAKNEPIGARIAGYALPALAYAPQEISVVQRLILATDLVAKPADKLEEILRDADVDNLGRADFLEKSDAVRHELGIGDSPAELRQWYANLLKFLDTHQWYTATAKRMREEQKQRNRMAVAERLAGVLG